MPAGGQFSLALNLQVLAAVALQEAWIDEERGDEAKNGLIAGVKSNQDFIFVWLELKSCKITKHFFPKTNSFELSFQLVKCFLSVPFDFKGDEPVNVIVGLVGEESSSVLLLFG